MEKLKLQDLEHKSISAIIVPATEEEKKDNPNHPGSAQVYISPDLTYPDIVQLLCTLMFHAMNSFYQVYASEIRKANIHQKIEANKKEARKNPIPQEAVMSETELDTAILNAAYQIHDSMNIAVSNVLNDFLSVPSTTSGSLAFLNPEDLITNEAILKAEQECLDNLLSSLTPAEQEIAKQHLDSLKDKILKAKDDYARMQMQNADTTDNE